MAAVPVVTWWAAEAGPLGICGGFFFFSAVSHYFLLQRSSKNWPLKKGGADCQHLVYGIHKTMACTKFPRCILNQAAMAMTVSVCERPYFLVVQHHMNISISCWQPVCHPLHSQELTFSGITTFILPYLSSPLPTSHPLYFSITFFAPFSSLCHWSLMRLAASVLSNDPPW